jgi:RNA recognition motif-containing protein
VTKKLYVGNLSYSTTEATLSRLFGEVGEVTSVTLITDRNTGRSKGFAFVEMAEDSDAQEAIAQLSGKELDGRAINVAEARPQQPRQNRFGGGDRGRSDRGGGSRNERRDQRYQD